jgi:predicted O-methyltransferase YrrM
VGRRLSSMKRLLHRLLPRHIRNSIRVRREKTDLGSLDKISCDTAALSRSVSEVELQELFLSEKIAYEWARVEAEVSQLAITDKASGVNPGDRRAIYYLIRDLRPKSILEIGTHIGASTVHIVAALQNRVESQSPPYRLTTVDIRDVNDIQSRPWLRVGSTYSPRDMIARMGAADRVEFVTSSSLEFLSSSKERYEFIFLDGDHSARTVYQEVPAALRILAPGGVILLHDYFPNLQTLWSNRALIPGPYIATQRLRSEGAGMRAVPLGALPWRTKLSSRVTSLALLVGEEMG